MSLVRESDAPVRRDWFSARLVMVVVASVAFVWVATVVVGGWKATRARVMADRTIGATASAKRHVTADVVQWDLTLSAHGAERTAAVRELRTAVEAGRAYLTSHEVKPSELSLYPAVTEENTQTITHHHADGSEDSEDVPHGFIATQKIVVRSGDIARVLRAYRLATSAAELGATEMAEPTCTSSHLDELAKELATAAHREVRAKAEADVAAMGGARLGKLLGAAEEGLNAGGLSSPSLQVCEQGTDAIATVRATYQLD